MQLTTLMSSFLLAASAVYAAPSQDLEARQIIPFNIALLSTNSCSNRYSSFFPNNGTACQVLSQPAASVFGTTALPSSCTITAYSNPTCSSVNAITIPRDTSCVSFGNQLKITSLKVSGTCPGFQS